jgi:hypothetical protein
VEALVQGRGRDGGRRVDAGRRGPGGVRWPNVGAAS